MPDPRKVNRRLRENNNNSKFFEVIPYKETEQRRGKHNYKKVVRE